MAKLTRRRFQAGALGTAALGAMPAPLLASLGEKVMEESETGLPLPARVIPVPKSISPQAQAFLGNAAKRIAAMGTGAPQRDQTQAAEAALQMLRPRAAAFKGAVETIDVPHGAKLYRITPEGRSGKRAEVAYLDIHGGGFTAGGGEMCRILAMLRASDLGVEVYAVDYRLAPDHPYPAGLDDTIAAYREVLKHVAPKHLVVAGSSAGGNLAAALLLRARDEGLPMPSGLLLLTPAADMAGIGDTRETNRFLDVSLYGGGGDGPASYAGKADVNHPYLSPVYGTFTKAWPPTLLASGTRDLLLSDTVRMHRALRRAGVAAELHVTEAGPHGGFMGTAPEDHELLAECKRFCEEAWGV